MPFTEIPFPFESSSSLKGMGRYTTSAGYGYNTWVEPATGLVGPRPRWKEALPQIFNTGSPQFCDRVTAIIPHTAQQSGGIPAVNGRDELTVLYYETALARHQAEGWKYSAQPGSVLSMQVQGNSTTAGVSWYKGNAHRRVVYNATNGYTWVAVAEASHSDQVLQVVRGAGGGSPPLMSKLPGLPVGLDILGMDYAGGRLFILATNSGSNYAPFIFASAVGGLTFVGGYNIDLSFNPEASSVFLAGSGIMAIEGRRLLVYGPKACLVYDINAASLTLANSLASVGTSSEGGTCRVRDAALMLGEHGLCWISSEVFKNLYKPETLQGGASDLASEWFKRLNVTPGAPAASANAVASSRLVSDYIPTWNCVFFSSPSLNETLYVYLGEGERHPYAAVWNTSWTKAWPVERTIDPLSSTPSIVANFTPVAVYQDTSGMGGQGRLSLLGTTELYDFQQNQAATYGEVESTFTAYAISAPLPLEEKDTPRQGASVRQTYLDIIYAHRDGSSGTLPMQCWWTLARRGSVDTNTPAIVANSPPLSPATFVPASDMAAAKRPPPRNISGPYEEIALLSTARVRVPYVSANGSMPRLVVYWPTSGDNIVSVVAAGVTWQPIKPNSASY